MDFTQQIEEIKQKLFSVGFTEEKYNELLQLASEEIMEEALNELQDKDVAILESLESNLIEEPKTLEDANRNIQLIFSTAYGNQAEQTRQRMILEYLNDTLQQTIATKDLLQRYQAGDPTAVASIESNKNNPEVQEFIKYMEETGGKEEDQTTPVPTATA